MKVISDKELRVATLTGAVVLFAPNQEREVSEEIGLFALQMGAKEVGGSTPEPEPAPAEERADWYGESDRYAGDEEDIPPADLVKVMEDLIDGGDPDNFKSDGKPKAAVVNKAAGRTVSTTEREAAWQEALNT